MRTAIQIGKVGRAASSLLAAAIVTACASPAAWAEPTASEFTLKSAFIYNFTKFVDWPPQRLANDPNVVIGVMAEDVMLAEMSAAVSQRQVNGRPIIVRPVYGPSDLQGLHLLFVSTREQKRFNALRKHVETDGVLLVGEGQCREHGGSICFTQQGDKLRFEINVDLAERANLKISAQLQKLAVAVHKG